MAHNLEFTVTLESSSSEELLALETMINSEELEHNTKLWRLVRLIERMHYSDAEEKLRPVIGIVDIHSADIIWDDDIPLDSSHARESARVFT